MPNGDLQDRYFNPNLTPMIDSYNIVILIYTGSYQFHVSMVITLKAQLQQTTNFETSVLTFEKNEI